MTGIFLRALLATAFLASIAQAQKAKSVEKDGDCDVVTLESGAVARVLVPKSLRAGERPGLVVALHGTSMRPEDMIELGRGLAEHRGDVWVACRGGTSVGGGFGWNPKGDAKDVGEMTRYAAAAYRVDGKRVTGVGFSGGAMIILDVVTANRAAFAGVVACAGPRLAWQRAAIGGLRAVAFLGENDDQFPLSPEYRKAVFTGHAATSFWVLAETGHQPPDSIYLNDALNYIFTPAEKPSEKKLPARPDHALADPAGRPAPLPEFTHVRIAWGSDRAAAKTRAEAMLARLRKKEITAEEAVAQSDEGGGAASADALRACGGKVLEKAVAMKPETWEIVEGESAFHILWRPK
ncbi:MAG: hypothetical protein HYY18_04495 [Planctomycetes bacterium]|nr:hypothetical protein [Planctomycetota bacterium]